MLLFGFFLLNLLFVRDGLCLSQFETILPSIGRSLFNKASNFLEVTNKNYDLEDDGYLDARQIAIKYDFVFEEHSVETQDGYILGLHRVHGKNGRKLPSTAPTVLMIHGILGSSVPFILDGDNSPAGILLSHGFDVWLGNIRGNRFGERHKWLKPSNPRFWNYTYYETIFYDLPAIVDYVLGHVKKPYLHGVGYSQGGIALSSLMGYVNPDYYNKKIRSLSFVASCLGLKKFKSDIFDWVLNYLAPYAVDSVMASPFQCLPHSNFWMATVYKYCNEKSIFFNVCRNIYQRILGQDNNTDWARFPYYLSHILNGISSNQILHFSKNYVENRGFSLFDFGVEKNLLKYDQTTPPDLDISNIDTNLLFFYGTEDIVIHKEAVLESASLAKNVKKVVEVEGYNHNNFLHGKNIKEKVYDVVADFINSHL